MTFATPLFLFALLAGAIPVVLHMINRQKAQPMPFSTLRFLRLSVQRTRRRKYLHDYVLLLLRVAGLLLIAVGLAQPTINRFGKLLGSGATSDAVLILDNSASMSMLQADGSRWEAARRLAYQIVDQLGEADSLALLLTCGPPRPELERLHADHEVIREVLDNCRPRHQRADLALRIRTAEKLLADSKAPNKEIYVITDMQEVSWQSLQRDASPEAAEAPPIILVDLHGDAPPNVAVKSADLKTSGPLAGVPMQLTVGLLGDATLDQRRHLELLFDDKVHATSPTISIEAGATAEHTFQFTIDRPGIHHGQVRLVGDDACSLDDARFFAVAVAAQVPVAVVKPREHAIAYLEDSFYLERALEPVDGRDWAIHATSLTADALAEETLMDYAVVFCVNLPALDAQQADRLLDYVRRGGHVVWSCGQNVTPARYAAMNRLAAGELLPAELVGLQGPTADRPDGWHIASIDTTYPALAPLAEPPSLYQSVQVYHYVEMKLVEDDSVRVLARLDNGDPLLVEHHVGSGSVMLLGTSVHVDWSNLPLRPIFLPLVAGLTFQLADAQASQPQRIAGTPIDLATAMALPNSSDPPPDGVPATFHGTEVILPSGAKIRFETGGDGEPTQRFTETHEVGIYEFSTLSTRPGAAVALAMNLDPEEVQPTTSSSELVREKFGERTLVVCTDPSVLAETVDRLRQGESLMEIFLLAVLFALIAESYVANRRVAQERPDTLAPRAERSPARRRLPVDFEVLRSARK